MTKPISNVGGNYLPPSPLNSNRRELHRGDDAFSDPVSPARVVPHVDRTQVNPEIVKAAEGMEAMFLDYMMQVMRQTVPKNDMDLDSPATRIYQSMMDSEYAQKAAHQGGIGLADQIIAYLDSQRYNINQGHGVPKKEKP